MKRKRKETDGSVDVVKAAGGLLNPYTHYSYSVNSPWGLASASGKYVLLHFPFFFIICLVILINLVF